MTRLCDDAICVRWWDWSETSQTVSLFTRGHGLLRGIAKGARRERAPFSGGIELLSRGEALALVKPGRTLHTLTGWTLTESYSGLRRSLLAFNAGMLAADVIARMLNEGDPHPEVFDALAAFLRSLDHPISTHAEIARFLLHLLRECGLRPELHVHPATRLPLPRADVLVFDPRLGGFAPDDHSAAPGAWRVRLETVDFLRELDAGTAPEGAGRPVERRAAKLLASILREVLGTEPPTFRFLLGEPLPMNEPGQANPGRMAAPP
ncbi:MAG: DNA repair protein RecO [Phycisphaerales bacterium]|nr:DNA repair protein RecO [Phycisphaerales bacterium]